MTTNKLLQLLQSSEAEKSLTDIFHRLNSVLPDEQQVEVIGPAVPVSEALAIMADKNYSQLPVVEGREVLGVFSYRSFARGLRRMASRKVNPMDMLVDEFVEKIQFARVTDEFVAFFDHLDRDDAVIAGEPDRLQGIVSAMDVLRYLYRVASPFVMIAEIELALRELIRLAVDENTLRECIQNSLKDIYKDRSLPTCLEEMQFGDYVVLVGDGRNWLHFEPVFRGDRNRTRAMLDEVRELRNTTFHFKHELSVEEYEALSSCRDWILRKIRSVEERFRGGRKF
jgi:CBS domain-containing protein